MKAKELPEPSLQVVPFYGLSHFLAGNDPQARPTLSVGTQEYQKIPGSVPLPPSRGRKKFPSNEKSVLFGKRLVRALASLCLQRVAHRVIRAFWGRHQVGGLYTEPLAALCPPTAHDLSSTSRLHASPKSVRSFSSNRAWLIGTFHGFFLLLSSRARDRGASRGFTVRPSFPAIRRPAISREREPFPEAGSIPYGSHLQFALFGTLIREHKFPPLSTSPVKSADRRVRPVPGVPPLSSIVSPADHNGRAAEDNS